MRDDGGAEGNGSVGGRRYITGDNGGVDRRVALLGRIDQRIEGGTVAAGRTMRAPRFGRFVVLMHDMGNRIHGERQQQAGERRLQPGWWISCQVEDGHTPGRKLRSSGRLGNVS